MQLPPLYPIVDTEVLQSRGSEFEPFVASLLAGGAGILQLRHKAGAPAEVLRQADAVSRAAEGSGCLLVMNDRADLAVLAGWHAVHVGQSDLPPEAARRVFGTVPSILGLSTHSDEQVLAAEASSANYVAIGPVFPTGSKQDADAVVGLEGVRRARALTGKPLVAIGGITLENAVEVRAAGADSVAVIGALVAANFSPERLVRDFLSRLR